MNKIISNTSSWVYYIKVGFEDIFRNGVKAPRERASDVLYTLMSTASNVLCEYYTKGYIHQSVKGIALYIEVTKQLFDYNLKAEEDSTITLSDRGGRFLGTFQGREFDLGPGEGTEVCDDSELYGIAIQLRQLLEYANGYSE